MTDDWLTFPECADVLGMSVAALRSYRWPAAGRHPKAARFPDPGRYFGRTPVWQAEVIEAWGRTLSRVPGRRPA